MLSVERLVPLTQVSIDLLTPFLACDAVAGGHVPHDFIRGLRERCPLVDDLDAGRIAIRLEFESDHRDQHVGIYVDILDSPYRLVEDGVHPYRGLVAVPDLEDHALPVNRFLGPNKTRIPVGGPIPFPIRAEQRPGKFERRIGNQGELLARVQYLARHARRSFSRWLSPARSVRR